MLGGLHNEHRTSHDQNYKIYRLAKICGYTGYTVAYLHVDSSRIGFNQSIVIYSDSRPRQ